VTLHAISTFSTDRGVALTSPALPPHGGKAGWRGYVRASPRFAVGRIISWPLAEVKAILGSAEIPACIRYELARRYAAGSTP
jgi:hypothetical protein